MSSHSRHRKGGVGKSVVTALVANMQPAGLEIFARNRRLYLAFPSNPGITFAPRTRMTILMRLTERCENGGKRKQRHIEIKIPRENPYRKETTEKRENHVASVKPGRPIAKKNAVPVGSNLFGPTGAAFVCMKLAFGQWCSDTSIRFYGKSYVWEIKSKGFISESPILELPLQMKSPLKITQRAEE